MIRVRYVSHRSENKGGAPPHASLVAKLQKMGIQ